MMNKFKLINLLFLIILSGCAAYFQPPKPSYKVWQKERKNELDVRKALLECGKPSPSTTIQMYKYAFNIDLNDDDAIFNKSFSTDACMEKLGYTRLSGYYTVAEYCSWDRYKHLEICQSNTVVPVPSVERRLNSWYCKIKTDYDYCLEHAINPSACNPEGYKNPPPECLP